MQQGGEEQRQDALLHTGDDHAPRSAADVLLVHVASVIAEWQALVRPKPWSDIPPPRLINSLPAILPGLVRGARSGATSVHDDLKDLIAHEHGSIRREDEIPVTAIAEEWTLLKEACRRLLEQRSVAPSDASRLLEHLDLLMDDALGYTLRGYYREELDTLRGRGLERRARDEDRRRSDRDDARDRRDGDGGGTE